MTDLIPNDLIFIPGWVTLKACQTAVFIPIFPRVFIIHFFTTVFVALQARKNSIIGGVGVTFDAAVPLIVMLSRKYGEELGIMYFESGRLPPWHGGMAPHAIS